QPQGLWHGRIPVSDARGHPGAVAEARAISGRRASLRTRPKARLRRIALRSRPWAAVDLAIRAAALLDRAAAQCKARRPHPEDTIHLRHRILRDRPKHPP